MAASSERRRKIADFFAAHERDVHLSVAYRVRHLPAAAIEDACQTAWEKLSCRPGRGPHEDRLRIAFQFREPFIE